MHGIFAVDVGAPVEKQRDTVNPAGARRSHEARLSPLPWIGAVRIGPGIEQPPNHGGISGCRPRGSSG